MSSNFEAYLAILTIITAFGLNLYKFPIMNECCKSGKPYKIFPWSAHPKISKSIPLWLIIHLSVSLALLFVSGYMIIDPEWEYEQNNFIVFSILHFFFTILILVNLTNFGDATPIQAVMINLTPLIIMNLAYFSNWTYRNEIYFVTLASPVFIEGYKYLTD